MNTQGKAIAFKPTNNFKYPIILKDDKLYVEFIPNTFIEARMIGAFKRNSDGMPGVRFIWMKKVYDVWANQIRIAA